MNTWLSLIPPIVAIVLAIITKRVFFSLLFGVVIGSFVIDFSLNSLFTSAEYFVNVFAGAGNTRTIIFSLLIGVIIQLVQKSGGVKAFTNYFTNDGIINSRKKAEFFAMFTGSFLFIESNISIITVGTVCKPIFKQFKIAKEKLAYIADSTCAPIAVLVPFNAWGAYLIAQLANYNVENSVEVFTSSILFFIYPIIAFVFTGLTIYFNWNLGDMKWFHEAQKNIKEVNTIEEEAGKMSYFLVPILTLVFGMITFMFITGDGVLTNGSGSKSVLYAILLSITLSYFLYMKDKIFTYDEFMSHSFEGIKHLLEVVLILVASFAINAVCKDLETGKFISGAVSNSVPLFLIPSILFVLSSAIAFSTGTSWGTFAIMLSVGIPIGQNLNIPMELIMGTVVSGGIFGDHCSPISDTTVMASLATECNHIDHVKSQLPYALIGGGISLCVFIILGLVYI